MLIVKEALSVGSEGEKHNEDILGFGAGYIFVMDGATGLSGKNAAGTESDARRFVRSVARGLHERLSDEKAAISDILKDITAKMLSDWKGADDDLPSAGIAVLRLRGEYAELFVLGDCTISVKLRSGEIFSSREEKLTALDGSVLRDMAEYAAREGKSMQEARAEFNDIILKNRALRNKPGGYWILDPPGLGIDKARTARFKEGDCESVLLYTDGFAELLGFGEAETPEGLHLLTEEKGVAVLMGRLFELQEGDRDMLRLPRFKFRDDTTAVFGEFK